eukprot:4438601-Pyramimonas_sp.AAC.1
MGPICDPLGPLWNRGEATSPPLLPNVRKDAPRCAVVNNARTHAMANVGIAQAPTQAHFGSVWGHSPNQVWSTPGARPTSS